MASDGAHGLRSAAMLHSTDASWYRHPGHRGAGRIGSPRYHGNVPSEYPLVMGIIVVRCYKSMKKVATSPNPKWQIILQKWLYHSPYTLLMMICPLFQHGKKRSSFNCFSLSLWICRSAVTISRFSASSLSSLLICFKFLGTQNTAVTQWHLKRISKRDRTTS